MGKEKGYITQMIDRMKTTKVPIAEPDTMLRMALRETRARRQSTSGQAHSILGVKFLTEIVFAQ
jgi:hypothetical protein